MLFKMLLRLFFIVCVSACTFAEYEIPEPKIQLLKPRGFRVSIPDEPGIQLFAFHANLNQKLDHTSAGHISVDVTRKTNGKWVYENTKLKLRPSDVIYYWVFVIKSGIGYRLDTKAYVVDALQVARQQKKSMEHRMKRHLYSDYSDSDMDGYDYSEPFKHFKYPNYHQQNREESKPKPYQYNYHHGGWPHNHNYHNHNKHNCNPKKENQRTTTTEIPVTTVRTTMKPPTTTTPIASSTFPNIDIRFGEA